MKINNINEINKLINRITTRNFDVTKKVEQEKKELLIKSFLSSPNSINGQQTSILIIDDKDKKNFLYDISGKQQHILDAPLVFMVIVDFYKQSKIWEIMKNEDVSLSDSVESLLVGFGDAGIATQSIVTTATLLNLTTTIVGAIRNDSLSIINKFSLPKKTFPFCLVLVGYDKKNNNLYKKPKRLSQEIQVFKNEYNIKKFNINDLVQYDKDIKELKNKEWTSYTLEYTKYILNQKSKFRESLIKSGFKLK